MPPSTSTRTTTSCVSGAFRGECTHPLCPLLHCQPTHPLTHIHTYTHTHAHTHTRTRSFYTIEEVDYDALIYCYYLNGYRYTLPPTLSHARIHAHVHSHSPRPWHVELDANSIPPLQHDTCILATPATLLLFSLSGRPQRPSGVSVGQTDGPGGEHGGSAVGAAHMRRRCGAGRGRGRP